MHVDNDKLLSNEYITHTYLGIDYDITWASNENTERTYLRTLEYNTLSSPTTHIGQGWGFGGDGGLPEIVELFSGLTGDQLLSKFTDENDGSFIHSFSHWNTLFTEPKTTSVGGAVVGAYNLVQLNFRSQWSWSIPLDDNIETDTDKLNQYREIIEVDGYGYATFYIRKTETTPVPEPSTLMIFALGLIALASRKKLIS